MKRFRVITPLVFLLAAAAGYFLFLTFSGHITPNPVSEAVVASVRPYPALASPKTVTLSCAYHGDNVSVDETLYGSLADYYRNNPAKYSAFYHNQNEKYVYSYKQDRTIPELTAKIKKIGTEKGLSGDQTLDLATCLLQSIPYDSEKAARILSPDYYKLAADQLVPRYPYETLYDGKGICTDKSFLGAAVFRELGYGTSLLTFDSQRHMSIGITVPDGMGDFGTKYGIVELTGSNFLVGDIPEISANAGLAVGGVQTIPNVTTDSSVTTEKKTALSALSAAIPISSGATYSRISERMALKNEISSLQPQLESARNSYLNLKAALTAAEEVLQQTEASYKQNPTNASYSRYSTTYNSYLAAYNAATAAVDEYNSLVNKYNGLVARYKEF